MKNLILMVAGLWLMSCGGNSWEIESDKFPQKNLKEFKASPIIASDKLIKDQEFLNYWYNTLFDGESESTFIDEAEFPKSYFLSWQTNNSQFKEFTIKTENECELSIYYIVMDADYNIISQSRVAFDDFCAVGSAYQLETKVIDDKTFEMFESAVYEGGLYPLQTVTVCKINSKGVFSCEDPIEIEPVVCLWEKLSVKESPLEKGAYKTSVYLGEVMTYLNETKVDGDSKDKVEYLKVRLSDGTEGWLQSRFVAQKAGLGAFLGKSFVYFRPNEINKSNAYFDEFDVAGIFEISDDGNWARVKGKPSHEKWFSEGWVKTADLTRYDADVKVAGLIKDAIKSNKWEEKYNQLKAIFEAVDFQESNFLGRVHQLMTTSPKNGNASVLKLKWKSVDVSQYGIIFAFENEKGEEITFDFFEKENMDIFIDDPYFTHFGDEKSMFGRYEINADIVDKWYWITFESRRVQFELSDEINDVDVITNIEEAK